MPNIFETDQNSLYHFGIRGQKWGVRRFETESGHLTPAGKARYDDYEYAKSETKKAKEKFKAANAKANSTFSQKDLIAANKAKGMLDLRKKQESDAKAKFKMNQRAEAGKKVGKHEQKLIEKFKEKGMSQEEAEVAAYKRAKLEKALAIGATVTVAAAAAYGAKKYHDYVSDEVLQVGKTSMKRIEADNSTSLHDTFYAARGKDVSKYEGLYGGALKGNGQKVYQKSIDLKENIKIASDKNAKDTMAEVFKNTSGQNKAQVVMSMEKRIKLMEPGSKGRQAMEKGLADIKAGKYDSKSAYDAFNIHMSSNHLFGSGDGKGDRIMDEYKQALKNKGYSGIKDRNDAKYSGYNAKSARIIFDTSKVKVGDVRQVSDAEITRKFSKEMGKVMMRDVGKQYGAMGVAALGLAAAGKAYSTSSRNKENNKAIADYKKEHPNTKLSNDEILENYYGDK